MKGGTIDVAVSVVRDGSGRVLFAERTARQVSAGFWELPGGKIDAGEHPQQAARRELAEEIGIEAVSLARWITYEHRFPTKRLRLHLFRVEAWRGKPHGREGQRLAWADPATPPRPLLPSNERALALLALPPLAVTTDSHTLGGHAAMLQRLAAALAAGARLVIVREPMLAPDQRAVLARRVVQMAKPYGARVLLQASPLLAARCGACGVHTAAAELAAVAARPPVFLWSVSCHDAAALAQAAALGADLALVSPVRPTHTHEGTQALGFEGLARLAAAVPLPIYAQGGMTPQALAAARAAGATGIVVALRSWPLRQAESAARADTQRAALR